MTIADLTDEVIKHRCPAELGYTEEDCWNDDCRTCWEKAIKTKNTIDSNKQNKL